MAICPQNLLVHFHWKTAQPGVGSMLHIKLQRQLVCLRSNPFYMVYFHIVFKARSFTLLVCCSTFSKPGSC